MIAGPYPHRFLFDDDGTSLCFAWCGVRRPSIEKIYRKKKPDTSLFFVSFDIGPSDDDDALDNHAATTIPTLACCRSLLPICCLCSISLASHPDSDGLSSASSSNSNK